MKNKSKSNSASLNDLLDAAQITKVAIMRKSGYSYMAIMKWFNAPEKMTIERSYMLDKLIGVPKGTVMDVAMARHTITDLKRLCNG